MLCSMQRLMASREYKLLIDNGANFHPQPDGTEYCGALYSSDYLRDLSMINLLVENGADVNPQYVCCDMAQLQNQIILRK